MIIPSPTRKPFPILLAALLVAAVLADTISATAQTPKSTPPAPTAKSLPPAQQPPAPHSALPPEVAATLTKTTSSLAEAEKALQHFTEMEEELGSLRIKVEEILTDTTQTAEQLRPQLAAVKSQIEKLGPPPAKDGPAEAPEMAAERARLTGAGSRLRWRHQVERADLGARAPADRAHHGAAALAVHQEPAGAAAEPTAAGHLARHRLRVARCHAATQILRGRLELLGKPEEHRAALCWSALLCCSMRS